MGDTKTALNCPHSSLLLITPVPQILLEKVKIPFALYFSLSLSLSLSLVLPLSQTIFLNV